MGKLHSNYVAVNVRLEIKFSICSDGALKRQYSKNDGFGSFVMTLRLCCMNIFYFLHALNDAGVYDSLEH